MQEFMMGIEIERFRWETCEIYLGRIETIEEAAWREVLDNAEQKRYDQYRFGRDKQRFAARRFLVKYLAARKLGVLPVEVKFQLGRYGKPEVRGLEMSWSGSGEMMAVIFGSSPVGIDIERIDENRQWEELWDKVAGNADTKADGKNFLRYWTAREALGKALGTGLCEEVFARELYWDEQNMEMSGGEDVKFWVRELEGGDYCCGAAVMGAEKGV